MDLVLCTSEVLICIYFYKRDSVLFQLRKVLIIIIEILICYLALKNNSLIGKLVIVLYVSTKSKQV